MPRIVRYLTIAGKEVLDPGVLHEGISRAGLPADYWGKANSITCPVGSEPGSAWVLVPAATMDSLDADSLHDLTWVDGDTSTTWQNYVIVRAWRVGIDGAGRQPYVVELQDKRRLLKMSALDASYNVRMPAPKARDPAKPESEYYTDTLNSGALWTWQGVLNDMWSKLPAAIAGAAPSLPYSPSGRPEELRYFGYSAWSAITELLAAIGCAIAYDPIGDAFEVVRVGTTQPQLSAALANASDRLLYDYQPLAGYEKADWPQTIRVYFPKRVQFDGQERDTIDSGNWEIQPYYWEDVATGATGAEPGTVLRVWDSQRALYDSTGTILNSADLNARAADIATSLKNVLGTFGGRLRQHFAGIVSNVLPGSQVREVVWRDYGDGRGLITEVKQFPMLDFMVGTDWAVVRSENFSRPDLARFSYPNWPHVSQIVQVKYDALPLGSLVWPYPNGLFPGNVRTFDGSTLQKLEPCWVRIINLTNANKLDGQYQVKNGDCFHGRLCGVADVSGDYRPVYLARGCCIEPSGYGSGSGSGSGSGPCLDVVTDVRFDPYTCKLTVCTKRVCLPAGSTVGEEDCGDKGSGG